MYLYIALKASGLLAVDMLVVHVSMLIAISTTDTSSHVVDDILQQCRP
jgi:hypothetical protein